MHNYVKTIPAEIGGDVSNILLLYSISRRCCVPITLMQTVFIL